MKPSLSGSQQPLTKASSLAGVLCGSNFSGAATEAVEVAAAIAKKISEPLIFVHAVNVETYTTLPENLRESLSLYARAEYYREHKRLLAMGITIIEAFRSGLPCEVILKEALATRPRILVLTSGKRRFNNPLSSGVAERVAESANTPTLVVRDPASLLQWIQGKRRLRILLGVNFAPPSEAALHWLRWFLQIGRYELVVAHMEQCFPSLALLPPSHVREEDCFPTGAGSTAQRYFRRWVENALGTAQFRIRFRKGWEHTDTQLIQLAAAENSDLIVTGTHSRIGLARVGHHSVSRGLIRHAPQNLVCVPAHFCDPEAPFEPPGSKDSFGR